MPFVVFLTAAAARDLEELFVNVTKKIPKPISVAVGREIVEDFLFLHE